MYGLVLTAITSLSCFLLNWPFIGGAALPSVHRKEKKLLIRIQTIIYNTNHAARTIFFYYYTKSQAFSYCCKGKSRSIWRLEIMNIIHYVIYGLRKHSLNRICIQTIHILIKKKIVSEPNQILFYLKHHENSRTSRKLKEILHKKEEEIIVVAT